MKNFNEKLVIVTGGAGFVGSHLTRRLLREGARVHIIQKPSSSYERIRDVLESVTIHDADITNTGFVKAIIDRLKPDGVFHLAGLSQQFGFIPSNDQLIDTNIHGTIKLMDAVCEHDISFFVNTGTSVEMGAKEELVCENDLCEPKDFYSISRIPATLYGQVLGREKAKPIITIRVFTPYGPFVQRGKIMYEMITKALCGLPLSLTRPTVNRDFIYIDDLVELYIHAALGAMEFRGHIFNGGSGLSTTLEELAAIVLEYTDSKSKIDWGYQNIAYDNARWQADTSKVKHLLSWSPRYVLKDGILKTIEWFREHKDYWINH